MVSEPLLWPPPPVVAGKSVQQTLTEIRAILELQLLKHESTVNEYAKRFEAILPYAPISNATAINLFVLGLRSEIRNVVLDFNPSSLTSAISLACLHEKSAKKVKQESKNADITDISSPTDNVAVVNHAQNTEIIAEAMGTFKDCDNGKDEGMPDLEAHEIASQENDIQKEEYGRLEQTESKIMNNAGPERTEGEADAVLNLTVAVVEEPYEIYALKVDEDDGVAAKVNLINDVIVEDEKCGRIKNWSKIQRMQELMPAQHDLSSHEGHGGVCRRDILSFPRRRFFLANRLLHFKGLLHSTKSLSQANQRKFVFDGSIAANGAPTVVVEPARSPASWKQPGRISCDCPQFFRRSSFRWGFSSYVSDFTGRGTEKWRCHKRCDSSFNAARILGHANPDSIAFIGAVALFIKWRSSDDGARGRAIKRILVACLLLLFFSPLAFCIGNNKRNYLVDFGDHHKDVQPHEVEKIHRSYLRIVKRTDEEAEASHIYSYKHSFNGLAASLTPEEASRLARIKGVVSVRESKIKKAYSLHTTRSWSFLDMKQPFNNSSNRGDDVLSRANYGQDVIVGVLDTSVWPESKELLEFSSRGSNQKFTALTRYWDGVWIWIPHSYMGSKGFGLMSGIWLLKFKYCMFPGLAWIVNIGLW